MTKRVLIIGGYGNFGSIIARRLASDPNIQLLIGGRNIERAKKFIAALKKAAVPPEAIAIDISEDISDAMEVAKPDIVIHTTGPFQLQGYNVLEHCLRRGCHYIDLADARSFVAGFSQFDKMAKDTGILALTGASSVPALTAAVIDYYRSRFKTIEMVDYGISAAQRTSHGLATVEAVLSYVGEPFTTLSDGNEKKVSGWQGLHAHKYPQIGWRLLGNCDIPDLELFPVRYPDLHTMRFSAGTELPLLQIGLWLLSWPVRLGIIPPLEHAGKFFQKIARNFDKFARNNSGFHMLMYGTGKAGEPRAEAFYMIARGGYGIHIPCIPAVILAKKLAAGTLTETGAKPCLDMIDLKTYCEALKGVDVQILRDVPIKPLKVRAEPKGAKGKKAGAKGAAKPGARPGTEGAATPGVEPGGEAQHAEGAVKTTASGREVTHAVAYDDTPVYSYKQDSAVPAFPEDKPLFVFDGVCVLCSRGAKWMMEKMEGEFRFASAQSPLGQALYKHYGRDKDDTYLLIDEGVLYTKTDGYFRVFEYAGPPWIFLYAFREVPRHLRDKLYDFVSRNRYKWFGQTEQQCELIPEEHKKNMLE